MVLLAFIPLYPKFPLLNIKGTFVAIRLEDFLIGLLLFLWVVYLLISKNVKNFLNDKLNQTLLLFFFIGGLSLFSGVFLTQTVKPHLGIFHYLRRIELMMLLPLIMTTLKTKKEVISSLVLLSGVVLAVNIYALGQQYLGWPVVSTTNSEFSKGLILYLTPGARVSSTFAGHYDLAVFLAMAIIILTILFFYFRKFLFKIYLLMLLGLSFFVLVLTAARLSFVASVIGVVMGLLLIGKKKFLLLTVALVAAALIYPSQLRDRFISTIRINIQQEGQRYQAKNQEQIERSRLNIPTLPVDTSSNAAKLRKQVTSSSVIASDITPGEPLDTTQLGVYRSLAIRLKAEWPRALIAFNKNPLLGTGYSSLGLATDNDFLRSLGEIGLLGTLAFALVVMAIVKKLWRGYRSSDPFFHFLSAGTLAMLVAFILNGLFIDVFEASKIASLFWLFIGINLALGRIYRDV